MENITTIRINDEGSDWANRIHISLSGRIEINSFDRDLNIWSGQCNGSYLAIPLTLIKTLRVTTSEVKR